jgi:hypothetical protein
MSAKPQPSQFGAAYRSFDRGLVACIDDIKNKLTKACDGIENRLVKVEDAVVQYVQGIKALTARDLDFASEIVTKEMRTKVLMSQWASSFIAGSRNASLDPIAYGFARFAFTICSCFDAVSAEYFRESNIHILMHSLMSFDSELVSGPATMALMHLSLHHDLRPDIVRIQALPTILKCLVNSNSQVVMTQACKLCASLALHDSNKSEIAGSGCFNVLLDLAGGMHKIVSKNTQRAAAAAVVNIIHRNNANRLLAVELEGVKAMLNGIRLSSNEYIILQGLRGLCNIAYHDKFCGSSILSAGGDKVIVDILESGDILRQPETVVTCLSCLTNCCITEATQAHIGSSGGAVAAAIRIIQHGREPRVVKAAAALLAVLLHNNTGNKARCAAGGAIGVILKQIIEYSKFKDDAHIECFEALCAAMASMMLYTTNHEKMRNLNGLPEMAKICKKSGQKRIVAAVAQVIVALTPSPDALYRYHIDEISVDIETYDGAAVLKKARIFAFGDDVGAPEWLELALLFLSMTDAELKLQMPWNKDEFVDKYTWFREFSTVVRQDSEISRFNGSKGLLFSIY